LSLSGATADPCRLPSGHKTLLIRGETRKGAQWPPS
jgi:hypothetical protein